MTLEEVQAFLPKYLSDDSERSLFKGLKDFPDNMDSRLFTNKLKGEKIIYQGDGIANMAIYSFKLKQETAVNGIILSNTCDLDLANKRKYAPRIVFCPIKTLGSYQTFLSKAALTQEQIDNHLDDIKKQRISQIFYLPGIENKFEDSIAFFDRACNVSNDMIDRESLEHNRLFSFGDYGFYLFLFRLSVHFTRIKEGVDRGYI